MDNKLGKILVEVTKEANGLNVKIQTKGRYLASPLNTCEMGSVADIASTLWNDYEESFSRIYPQGWRLVVEDNTEDES